MPVLLDLWGTILDGARMNRAYARRLAEILTPSLGGEASAWIRAHDEALAWYTARANAIDWSGSDYLEKADALDAEHLDRLLGSAGIAWRPEDPVAYARDLEFRVMSSVNARFPDADAAIRSLRKAGHRVHVVTSATDSNARGSLTGAGLLDQVDGVFTGDGVGLHKSTVGYWHRVTDAMGLSGEPALVVDDRLDFLRPAAIAGLAAILLDREASHPREGLPSFVRATLRDLAGLPHLADLYAAGSGP